MAVRASASLKPSSVARAMSCVSASSARDARVAELARGVEQLGVALPFRRAVREIIERALRQERADSN